MTVAHVILVTLLGEINYIIDAYYIRIMFVDLWLICTYDTCEGSVK